MLLQRLFIAIRTLVTIVNAFVYDVIGHVAVEESSQYPINEQTINRLSHRLNTYATFTGSKYFVEQ